MKIKNRPQNQTLSFAIALISLSLQSGCQDLKSSLPTIEGLQPSLRVFPQNAATAEKNNEREPSLYVEQTADDSSPYLNNTYLLQAGPTTGFNTTLSAFNSLDETKKTLTATVESTKITHDSGTALRSKLIIEVENPEKVTSLIINGTHLGVSSLKSGEVKLHDGTALNTNGRLPGFYFEVSLGDIKPSELKSISVSFNGQCGAKMHIDIVGEGTCYSNFVNPAEIGTSFWINGPDCESPDANLTDSSIQDGSIQDATPPDASVPDANIPDMDIPDANVPDACHHDASVPDANIPDANIPDANAPDACHHDASVPDAGKPDSGCDGGKDDHHHHDDCSSDDEEHGRCSNDDDQDHDREHHKQCSHGDGEHDHDQQHGRNCFQNH